MSSKQIFAIDFGSENIRLARSTQNPHVPQVLRPNLLNLARVDRNQGVTAVGDSVYDGVHSGSVISAINVFDDKLGAGSAQALSALLQEIFIRFEMDRLTTENKAECEVVFSMPIGYSLNDSKIVELRLTENGFPPSMAYSAARAIFLNYFYERNLQPGTYLILDCGSLHTRMAACKVDGARRFSQIENVSGNTGGGEIDRLLLQYFGEVINDPQIPRGELLEFTRQFKKGFLNKILHGSTKFVSRSPFSTGVPAFDLTLDDFERLSESYFKAFEESIRGFLVQSQIGASHLSGILLAGANSQWPAIIRFAEDLVGKEKVYTNEFPEDVIVKGLVLSALEAQPVVNRKEADVKVKPSPQTATVRKRPEQKQSVKLSSHGFSLWTAALLAFLEFFMGLFGILGIGWLIGTHTIFGLPWKGPWWRILFLRVPLIFTWLLIFAAFVAVVIGLSVQSESSLLLLLLPFLWCGIPFASAALVFWTLKNMK